MRPVEITRGFTCYDQYPHGFGDWVKIGRELTGYKNGKGAVTSIPLSRLPHCPIIPISRYPLLHGGLQRPQWPARPDAPRPLPPRHPHPTPAASYPCWLLEETIQVGASTVLHLHPAAPRPRRSAALLPWPCVGKSYPAWSGNRSTDNCLVGRDAADASYSSTRGWRSSWPRSRSGTEYARWRYQSRRTTPPPPQRAPLQRHRDSKTARDPDRESSGPTPHPRRSPVH